MAKQKQRKQVRDTAVSPIAKKSENIISAPRQVKAEDKFRVEYAYVIKDLRTVFILAAVMFTLLIVLNLVLR